MTAEESNRSQRIAKNTLMLYIRMALVMVISLYTSRIVLNILGVEDYGIYNVVGGVIGLFSFITSSMSSATSRFLSYHIGKDKHDELNEVFKVSFTLHIIFAFIVFTLFETIGVWFLETKMVIPESRMSAARIVFQTMVVGAMFSVLKVPFYASILSHERLNVYAIIEIIASVLNLFVCISLKYFSFDRLVIYSILLFAVQLIATSAYIIYSMRNFEEVGFRFSLKKEFVMPVLSFSSWDLFGNMSVVIRTQGVQLLLNFFYGPIINAACGIATLIQSATHQLSGSVLLSAKPQIIKLYSQNRWQEVNKLIQSISKLAVGLLLLFMIPLSIEINFILKVWLINPPQHANVFSLLSILFVLFATFSSSIMSGIHATGKVKKSSFINGTLYLSVLPLTYIFLKFYDVPEAPYILNAIFVFLGGTFNTFYLHSYISDFSVRDFFLKVCVPIFIVSSVVTALCIIPTLYLPESWLRLILTCVFCWFFFSILYYTIVLDKNERGMIIALFKKRY